MLEPRCRAKGRGVKRLNMPTHLWATVKFVEWWTHTESTTAEVSTRRLEYTDQSTFHHRHHCSCAHANQCSSTSWMIPFVFVTRKFFSFHVSPHVCSTDYTLRHCTHFNGNISIHNCYNYMFQIIRWYIYIHMSFHRSKSFTHTNSIIMIQPNEVNHKRKHRHRGGLSECQLAFVS